MLWPCQQSTAWGWVPLPDSRSSQQHLWGSFLESAGLKNRAGKRCLSTVRLRARVGGNAAVRNYFLSPLFKSEEPFLVLCPFHSPYVFVSLG